MVEQAPLLTWSNKHHFAGFHACQNTFVDAERAYFLGKLMEVKEGEAGCSLPLRLVLSVEIT